MIQLTDHMKLNKKEVPSVADSTPFRSKLLGSKIITGGRGREAPTWERRGGREKVNRIRYGGEDRREA